MSRLVHSFILIIFLQITAASNLFAYGCDFNFEVLFGSDIRSRLDDITTLSLNVYREYPYFYDGTQLEYQPIIQHYSESNKGIACVLLHHDKPIGVALGQPSEDMRDHYLQAILSSPLKDNLKTTYYLGEILLLKEYRRKGLGKMIYNEFENQVKSLEIYDSICLCIIEEDEHILKLKPDTYQTLNSLWKKLGFVKIKNFSFDVAWQNVDEYCALPHKMIFLSKALNKQ